MKACIDPLVYCLLRLCTACRQAELKRGGLDSDEDDADVNEDELFGSDGDGGDLDAGA
jgi:hypothetical protein